MSVVENAVYTGGRRLLESSSLAQTYQLLRDYRDDPPRTDPGDLTAGVQLDGEHELAPNLAWIGLFRPDARELSSMAVEFGLHELAVEDAIQAHQRPKLERYGKTLFVVLLAARYVDAL